MGSEAGERYTYSEAAVSTIPGYRSILVDLYRRYVRRHRRCLTLLYKMDRAECFTVVGDEVCVTCLAYFAWRMSVENLVKLEGFFRPRKADFEIRLAQLSARFFSFSLFAPDRRTMSAPATMI